MRPVWKRTLAVIAGTLAVPAVLELGLQVAAARQAAAVLARVASENDGNRPVVVFVGDSNIYGIYVEPAQTLPKVVERLSRAGGARGIHAINRGVPGSPSWVVLEQARRALDYKPVAIVARCGINNYSAAPPGEGFGVLEKLRLVKLLRNVYVNWQWRDAKPFDVPSGIDGTPIEGAGKKNERAETIFRVPPRDGNQDPILVIWSGHQSFAEFSPRMNQDFLEMARLANGAGARLILTTYMAGESTGFAPITAVQRGLAGRQGIVVADCSKLVQEAVDASRAGKVGSRPGRSVPAGLGPGIFLTRDRHPTAIGYELEARVVVNAMRGAGILPAATPLDPLEPLSELDVGQPVLRRVDGSPNAFAIEGRPQDRCTLLLGKPGSSVVEDLTIPLDVRPLDAIAGPRQRTGMSAVADENGKARLEIPQAFMTKLRGTFIAACLVQRGGRGPSSQRILSEPLTLRIGE